jgi:cytochrome b involved in lipid metabolism
VLGGKVYNITPYLPYHPGGEPELMKCAGRDGTKLFAEIHPWVNWEGMLGACLIGIAVGEAEVKEVSTLDNMD